MKLTIEQIVARIMRLENALFNNNGEGWHNVVGDSGWSAVSGYSGMKYRMNPDGQLQFTGAAQHTNFTTTTAINSSNPLAAAYRPVNAKILSAGNNPTGLFQVEFHTDGIVYALANANTTTATKAIVDAIVPLNV